MVSAGRSKGFDVMALRDSDVCALCAQEVEILDHLLVDCVFS
jgi:hypothetical protein